MLPKAVTDDDIIREDIIVDSPAETGVIFDKSFDVFKAHPNKLRIFLHSSLDRRIARIMERYDVDEEKARILIEDNDYTRELYTKTFTGKDWYDSRNYDIALDVTKFGVNGAVDFLMRFIDE